MDAHECETWSAHLRGVRNDDVLHVRALRRLVHDARTRGCPRLHWRQRTGLKRPHDAVHLDDEWCMDESAYNVLGKALVRVAEVALARAGRVAANRVPRGAAATTLSHDLALVMRVTREACAHETDARAVTNDDVAFARRLARERCAAASDDDDDDVEPPPPPLWPPLRMPFLVPTEAPDARVDSARPFLGLEAVRALLPEEVRVRVSNEALAVLDLACEKHADALLEAAHAVAQHRSATGVDADVMDADVRVAEALLGTHPRSSRE